MRMQAYSCPHSNHLHTELRLPVYQGARKLGSKCLQENRSSRPVTKNFRRRRRQRAGLLNCIISASVAASAPDVGSVFNSAVPESVWKNPIKTWQDWWDLRSKLPDKPKGEVRKLSYVVKRLWQVMRVNKWLLASAFLSMFLAAASELAIPHYTSATVFAVAKQGNAEVFYRNVKLLAVLSLSYGLFSGLRGFSFSLLNSDLIQNLRAEVFRGIVRQEVAYFDEAETGVLTSRLGSDCHAVARAAATNINVALRNSLQCIGGAIYLYTLSKELALACGAVTAVLWASAIRYGKFSRKAQRAYQDALASTTEVAQEVFGLSRIVRTFGTEEREVSRYRRCLQALRDINIRQAFAYLMYLITASSLFNLTKVLSLLIGGGMALKGVITAQQLTTFVLYVEFVTYASLNVCDQWGSIMESIGASERVMEFLDTPAAPQIAAGRVLPNFSGQVTFKNVTYSYPSRPKILALSNLNLTITPGRVLALVGLSGSGKSTLVAMLQRHYDPTDGSICLDDTDLREIDAGWYRKQLGVVSQDPRLFTETISENIAYGSEGLSQEEVEEAARLANAHAFITALPKGYSTLVTDKLLSGGQKQRIAMARALVRNPRLLILDEATSALDTESEALVQESLDRVMQSEDRAIIVIAHRLSTVRNADHIAVMKAGQIAEEGSHAQLMKRRGIYYSLVRRQTGDGTLGTTEGDPLKMDAEDDKAEAASHALSWFGFAEVYSNGNDSAVKSLDASISIDESFDEGRLSDHSKEALVS